MAHVFLSYSREDVAAAERLSGALEAAGLEVWWDRTIPPGKTFDQVIEEALDSSSWAIVLWSATSVQSNWVKAEAEEALRRGTLVPVLIEDVRPPLAFRRIEAAELQDWDGDPGHPEFVGLLSAMGRDAPPPPRRAPSPAPAKPQPAPEPAPRPAGPRPGSPRMATGVKIALGLGAAILLVLGTLVATKMGSRGGGTPARQQATESRERPVAEPDPTLERRELEQRPQAESTTKYEPAPVERRALRAVAAEPAPATADITLQYIGDAYGCELLLEIAVGSQRVTPSSNVVHLEGVPLGSTRYRVGGTIGCPGIGVCKAAGSGVLDVVQGGVYNLVWANTAPVECSVELQRSG